MNWEHFDKLYRELETMPARWFNYMQGYYVGNPECACCVAGHSVRVAGFANGYDAHGIGTPVEFLREFLDITPDEARAVYVPCADAAATRAVLGADDSAHGTDMRGENARQRALSRLRRLADRHARPETPMVSAFQPDDAHFLASIRALALEAASQ